MDAADNEGSTPLHAALIAGHTELVSLLLARDADPYIADATGLTALDLARDESMRRQLAEAAVASMARPKAQAMREAIESYLEGLRRGDAKQVGQWALPPEAPPAELRLEPVAFEHRIERLSVQREVGTAVLWLKWSDAPSDQAEQRVTMTVQHTQGGWRVAKTHVEPYPQEVSP